MADSSGTVQTSYTFHPFGNATPGGQASPNDMQYTGRENDGTGLQYNRARYYSPSLQRFISEDPLGFGGGDVNLYASTDNDPVNATDPSGQIVPECVVGAAMQMGFGYAFAEFSERKYTWQNAAKDAAMGCMFGVADPEALAGEGAGLAGDGVRAAEAAAADTLPDDALVARSGVSEALSSEGLAAREGTHPSGVTGWSAESRAGACLEELCARIPNNQVGVTTVGDIRAAGGDVVPTSGRSPTHVTITGISPEDLSPLLNPPIQNPVPPAERIR